MVKPEIKNLIDISRLYGTNKDFVLGGGGNTSYKDEQFLWIKASGKDLANLDENGLVQLDRKILHEIQIKSYSTDSDKREEEIKSDLYRACVDPSKGLRPSVETSLHNLLSYRYVVHLHPWLVNALLCSRNSRKISQEILGDLALYVGYTDPGYVLFKLLEKEIQSYQSMHGKDPAVILLENHGIFVGGNSTEEIKGLYDAVLDRIKKQIPTPIDIQDLPLDEKLVEILPAIRMMLSKENLKVASVRNNSLIAHFSKSFQEGRKVSSPFTPDQIVYCKSKYLFLDQTGSPEIIVSSFENYLDRFRTEFGFDPKVILIKDLGLVVAEDNYSTVQTVLDVYEDLMKISYHSEFFGGQRFLTPDQVSFIDHWEVENYRRKVSTSSGRAGKMTGKTAIVTGAAMGFGAGIAESLFQEGANIIIADINAHAGQEFEEKLNMSGKKNHAHYLPCDVSSLPSVKDLVSKTVFLFGGLDLYVSNAGILKAGGLDEMDVESFERMTKVNYTGFFIGAKCASTIMKIQNVHHPSHFTDIVQINSKSGLRGSNRNFAYAGGKFGGIGLTQSFALELIGNRIKVNAICPGNFFEGPLWSDPKNGLFVQYLKAGKVPGARTIEEVKRYYEDQVPAKRGCRVEDVMKALYYIIDQEYETGQAIPVTGGQVMLN